MLSPYSSLIAAILGLCVGGAVTWGAMRKTVAMLSTELAALRQIVSELIPLKTHSEYMARDIHMLQENVQTLNNTMQDLRTSLAGTIGLHTKGE